MDQVAVGFWGGFFGTASLMLAAALVAYANSLHRVAVNAAVSALASAFFAVAFLRWLPLPEGGSAERILAHVAIVTAAFLGLMLLAMLGLLKRKSTLRRFTLPLIGGSAAVLALGWLLEPSQALALSCASTVIVGVAALAVALRSAARGDRLAWLAVGGVCFMLIAVCGLTWIVFSPQTLPWPVHALSAVAGMAYLATMATALWVRYSYLIELRRVLDYGPSYDPVTRLRSHEETGQMVGAAFRLGDGPARPVGVIVISLGNLYALEQLHGRSAMNHALFICASRLRRILPLDVEAGRLADDGFLLLVKNTMDHQRLVALARQVAERLQRPVDLSINRETAMQEGDQLRWVADLGIGVLVASVAHIKPSSAVAMARAMSRTAWSYASRIAWFDQLAGQIAELPRQDED